MIILLFFRFEKEVLTHNDVRGYRFTPAENVFADVSINPENDCFCPSGPPCTPHGMFNVSLCQYGKLFRKCFHLSDQVRVTLLNSLTFLIPVFNLIIYRFSDITFISSFLPW